MTCRGMELESDIDNVLSAAINEDNVETAIKKFLATKNCKKETALKWALQRANTAEARKKVQDLLDSYFASQENLI